SRGEEKRDLERIPGCRARRWVVERTHSWMNRFRRLLVRWEKKKVNFPNMIYLACAVITFRAAGVLG
ncbi:MAG TPA: transposase, partial [Sumerlaeia bacterium]|nr:transposase [Sumerlaeia bacterium]